MDNTIVILGLVLILLVLLNHITIVTTTTTTTTNKQPTCSQTAFGCCPDGVNSKINYFGSNCPGFKPGPGYFPTPYVPHPGPRPYPGPKPIGGCAGTRYGCCPNNQTPRYDQQGSNCKLLS